MTSNSRTAGCGPACPVVWQGRLPLRGAPYADWVQVLYSFGKGKRYATPWEPD